MSYNLCLSREAQGFGKRVMSEVDYRLNSSWSLVHTPKRTE